MIDASLLRSSAIGGGWSGLDSGSLRAKNADMPVDLPRPIAAYIAAENAGDAETLGECFAERGIVRDEKRTFVGRAAIEQWNAESRKKYQHTVEPLAVVHEGDKTIVTNRLTGNFPGSPIELQFTFVLDGDMIASLDIHG